MATVTRRARVAMVVIFVILVVSLMMGRLSVEPFVSPIYKSFIPLVYTSHAPAKGVGLKHGDCVGMSNLGVEWFYNWGFDANSGGMCNNDKQYVDMIFGASNMSDTIKTPYLMGFNEYNQSDQGNLTPTRAAMLWRVIESVHADKYLVSPSGGSSLTTLWAMVDTYRALYGTYPRFDAISVHWYDSHSGGTTLQSYLSSMHMGAVARGYNGKLWLTEFASCTGNTEYKIAKMREWMDWLATTGYVERWAWYAGRLSSIDVFDQVCQSDLMNSDGTLTPLGVAYRDWPKR